MLHKRLCKKDLSLRALITQDSLFFSLRKFLLTNVHRLMYNHIMKKKDVEASLGKYGWWLDRHGSSHDIWTNGEVTTQVPRHRDINEYTAKSILKKAKTNPHKKRIKKWK